MNWYVWESFNAFNDWHKELCNKMGLPSEKTKTTDYTIPVSVNNVVIAQVENIYAENLTPTNLTPQPYPSWTLDESLNWQPPTPKPNNGFWLWNETLASWVEVTV